MTRVQDIILEYVKQEYVIGTYETVPIGFDKVRIVNMISGTEVILSANFFGDIIDMESRRIIATSNVPHDISCAFLKPTDWTLRDDDYQKGVKNK